MSQVIWRSDPAAVVAAGDCPAASRRTGTGRVQIDFGRQGPGGVVHDVDVGRCCCGPACGRRAAGRAGRTPWARPSSKGSAGSRRSVSNSGCSGLFLTHGQHPAAVEHAAHVAQCQVVHESLAIVDTGGSDVREQRGARVLLAKRTGRIERRQGERQSFVIEQAGRRLHPRERAVDHRIRGQVDVHGLRS